MSYQCAVCEDEVRIPHTCNYCGIRTCSAHYLPESHECVGLNRQRDDDGKWFKERLSSNRRHERLSSDRSSDQERSHPKALDSDEITTYGSSRSRIESGSHGPDTAPDGSLVYDNDDEPEHTPTLDQNRRSRLDRLKDLFAPLKDRLAIYRIRARLILSSPTSLLTRLAIICIAIVLIVGLGGLLGVPAMADLTDSDNGDFGGFFDSSINESQVEHEISELVDEERTNRSGSTLRSDDALAAMSQSHSEDMGKRDYYDHTSPDGVTAHDRLNRVGCTRGSENIAHARVHERVEDPDGGTVYISDETELAGFLVDAWMNSSGHRENILDPRWTSIGVGIHITDDNEVYATQMFCI